MLNFDRVKFFNLDIVSNILHSAALQDVEFLQIVFVKFLKFSFFDFIKKCLTPIVELVVVGNFSDVDVVNFNLTFNC